MTEIILISVPVLIFGQKYDWNCKRQCGLYDAEDDIAPALHSQCFAYDRKYCKKVKQLEIKNNEKKKLENKINRKKGGQTRIVGGKKAKKPFPWMVALLINGIKVKKIFFIYEMFRRSMWRFIDKQLFCLVCCSLFLQW